MEQGEGCTFLYDHCCKACGNPIAARHEAIGDAMIKLDALATDVDVDGDLSPLYCPACLADALELADSWARLWQLGNANHEVDVLLGISRNDEQLKGEG
nr:hypothetical protein [Candidatus Sigynarchaeota archaeon]